MALINCPECGNEISDRAERCPNCGYYLIETKFCKYCGQKIKKDSIVCEICGKPQIQSNETVQKNSSKEINKTTSLLLCIFLGYFGIHKFYEGKIGMGVLYLFTMGLFGIGWIVDIVAIALKPNPYYV